MPNIKSAKKRVKVIATKTRRNRALNSNLKTTIKKGICLENCFPVFHSEVVSVFFPEMGFLPDHRRTVRGLSRGYIENRKSNAGWRRMPWASSAALYRARNSPNSIYFLILYDMY